ncbi:MAG: hypothetical protein AVDCRST_MAG73-1543, partial [uncultured Thermomicrobiales bacterium]
GRGRHRPSRAGTVPVESPRRHQMPRSLDGWLPKRTGCASV